MPKYQKRKKKEIIRNYYPLCGKCKKEYPLMIIIYNTPIEILLRCKCGYENIYSVKELIYYIKDTEANVVYLKCKKHNEPYYHYCYICKKHFCAKCLHSHSEIDYNYLIELNKIDIDAVQANINKCKRYIIEALTNITNEYELRPYIELRQAFRCFKKRNFNFVFIIQCLVNTLSKEFPNYYLEQSIRNNQLSIYNYKIYLSNRMRNIKSGHNSDNFEDPKVIKSYLNIFAVGYFDEATFISPYNSNLPIDISSILFIEPCYLLLSCRTSVLSFYNTIKDTIDYTIDIQYCCTDKSILLEKGKFLSYAFNGCVATSFTIKNKKIDFFCDEPINFKTERYSLRVIALSDNRIAISGHNVYEVIIQRITKPCDVLAVLELDDSINSECFYKEGNKLLTAGDDLALTVWNLDTYQKETVFSKCNYTQSNSLKEIERGVFKVGHMNIVDLNKYTSKQIDDDDREKYGLRLKGGIQMFSEEGLRTSVGGCVPYEKINKYVEEILDKRNVICVDENTFISITIKELNSLTIWKY